jgi:HEAT repeat protein
MKSLMCVAVANIVWLSASPLYPANLSEPGRSGTEEILPHDNFLQSLQQEALPDLLLSILGKKPPSRFRVTAMINSVQGREACNYLVKAYDQTQDIGVRCKILESIGKFHDRTRLEWLTQKLEDSHLSIQCFALWAIGELRDPRAADVLRHRLHSPHNQVRMVALDGLGKQSKNTSIAHDLCSLLQDPDVGIRYLAAKALLQTAGPDHAPMIAEALLGERSADVQGALARSLGRSGDTRGTLLLIELLKNAPSQAMEHWAVIGLQAARPGVLIPQLAPLLEGKDFPLKLSASHILAEHESPLWDGLDPLWQAKIQRWARAEDEVLRTAATRYLERARIPR